MEDEPDPTPHFDAAGRLVAPRYDDLYFSIADGLAETTHVFLDGNDLGPRFAALGAGDTFTVGETGFGTGLNFLACWRRFASCAPAGARLRFVTVEKEPLSPETICRALAPWPELAPELDALLEQYAPGGPGVHRVLLAGGRVELVLLIGEAAEVLADESAPMDAWFLDGFAPARNPAMWSDDVFEHVARLSTTGTTLATYTVAGAVRRGLAVVGFEVAKRPGFGTKRDMAAGRFVGPQAAPARSENSQRIGVDVLVIGAGLAGIGGAARLARDLPHKNIAIFERRERIGGTWDLFRYPGIRSDSDMYTLGYGDKPWTGDKAIADGADIRAYVVDHAHETGVDRMVRYGLTLARADWSSADRLWTLDFVEEATGGERRVRARFIYMATGYYDYDRPYLPRFEGEATFDGPIVHPQHWPDGLAVEGKRIALIGSGATAITLAPGLAEKGARVTLIQRSPSYVIALPSRVGWARSAFRWLPDRWAYRLARGVERRTASAFYRFARAFPKAARQFLAGGVEEALGAEMARSHFDPLYDPWTQRLCIAPDGDLGH